MNGLLPAGNLSSTLRISSALGPVAGSGGGAGVGSCFQVRLSTASTRLPCAGAAGQVLAGRRVGCRPRRR